MGVKINLLDQKIFHFAAHQTNFVFRQGLLRRARLFFFFSPLLFLHLLTLFSLIKKHSIITADEKETSIQTVQSYRTSTNLLVIIF